MYIDLSHESCDSKKRMGSNVMEKKQVVVSQLSLIVIFFISSIVLLNKQKQINNTATHIDIIHASAHSIATLSLEQVYSQLIPLLISHNIDLIIKVINQGSYRFASELVEKIIKDPCYSLSSEEKVNLLFGIILNYSGKKSMQYRLLDILKECPEMYNDSSVLLAIMRSNYSDSLFTLYRWIKDNDYTDEWNEFIYNALRIAIDQEDYRVVENMFSKKIRVSAEKSSQLLSYIVEHNKSTCFIPLLVRHHADINSIHNNKTLLMQAVEHNNTEMIQVLLDEGAVVDRVIDPHQGTALQIAMARKHYSAIHLLREYGA
jgi:hypothetical protein